MHFACEEKNNKLSHACEMVFNICILLVKKKNNKFYDDH